MEQGEGEANAMNGKSSVAFVACTERNVVECQFLVKKAL